MTGDDGVVGFPIIQSTAGACINENEFKRPLDGGDDALCFPVESASAESKYADA